MDNPSARTRWPLSGEGLPSPSLPRQLVERTFDARDMDSARSPNEVPAAWLSCEHAIVGLVHTLTPLLRLPRLVWLTVVGSVEEVQEAGRVLATLCRRRLIRFDWPSFWQFTHAALLADFDSAWAAHEGTGFLPAVSPLEHFTGRRWSGPLLAGLLRWFPRLRHLQLSGLLYTPFRTADPSPDICAAIAWPVERGSASFLVWPEPEQCGLRSWELQLRYGLAATVLFLPWLSRLEALYLTFSAASPPQGVMIKRDWDEQFEQTKAVERTRQWPYLLDVVSTRMPALKHLQLTDMLQPLTPPTERGSSAVWTAPLSLSPLRNAELCSRLEWLWLDCPNAMQDGELNTLFLLHRPLSLSGRLRSWSETWRCGRRREPPQRQQPTALHDTGWTSLRHLYLRLPASVSLRTAQAWFAEPNSALHSIERCCIEWHDNEQGRSHSIRTWLANEGLWSEREELLAYRLDRGTEAAAGS